MASLKGGISSAVKHQSFNSVLLVHEKKLNLSFNRSLTYSILLVTKSKSTFAQIPKSLAMPAILESLPGYGVPGQPGSVLMVRNRNTRLHGRTEFHEISNGLSAKSGVRAIKFLVKEGERSASKSTFVREWGPNGHQ
ncbi:MAG: hypothetical protein IPM67_01510 [Sphingomonadales bacterium]|nr:hypothetical protein [Sphingomonadales bacterium]